MNLQGRNLSASLQGQDVALLHGELGQLTFAIQAAEVQRHVYGPTTQQAVQDFQRKHGLPVTGIVDPSTARAINAAVDALQPPRYSVAGQVCHQDGTALSGLTVRAFDRDLRSGELLGEGDTDATGHYAIIYTAAQFRRAEKKSADLIMRVFSPEGVQLTASEILFNAPGVVTIDLVVEPHPRPLPAEYEHLLADLTPRLEGVPLGSLTDDDIAFLVGETGNDRQQLAVLRQAAQLAQATGLPGDACYGLARQQVPLDLDSLLAHTPVALRSALENAIQANIVPSQLRDALDGFIERFQGLQLAHGVLVRCEVIGRLLNQETSVSLTGFTVRAFDLDDGPEPLDLGHDVTNAEGLFALMFLAPRPTTPGARTPPGAGRRLRLQILDAQAHPIQQTDVMAPVDESAKSWGELTLQRAIQTTR